MIRLSAFADEISDDLNEQIAAIRSENIHFIDLRGVWNTNVLDLTEQQVSKIKQRLDEEEERGQKMRGFTSPAQRDAFLNSPQERERSRRMSDAIPARSKVSGVVNCDTPNSTNRNVSAKAPRGPGTPICMPAENTARARNPANMYRSGDSQWANPTASTTVAITATMAISLRAPTGMRSAELNGRSRDTLMASVSTSARG